MYASKPVKQKTAALGTSYIHDIELFHLKRTSAVRRSQCGKKVSSQKPDYYLFDYYDSLSYLQDAQSVEDFLGISDSDHDPSAIASQYQALIDVQGGMRKGGLFVQSEMDQTLPFIAVVSITILPKATSQDRKDTGTADSDASHAEGTGTEANTEQFLQDCVAEINDILEAGIQSFALDGENIAYKTYLCLNSGNFCIVMRSNSPELSYRLTMHLRSCCLNPEQHNGFPSVICSTYTIMGIKFRTDGNGAAVFNAADVAKNCKTNVVLRFSTEDLAFVKKLSGMGASLERNPCGLFGRYDLTLTLNMVQFGELYPWICARKFGMKYPSALAQTDVNDPILDELKAALGKKTLNCINERLLVDIKQFPDESTETYVFPGDIDNQNELVSNELKKLKDRWLKMPFYALEYGKCVDLLIDLWNNYQNLRGDEDSFINGNMLLAQVMMLIKSTNQYLDSMSTAFNNMEEHFYHVLLEKFREAVDSISHFQKMMQSVNRQTIQAPTYEVQMHADLEKIIIAFTEFSRRYLNTGLNYRDPSLPEAQPHQRIMPIIMTDTREEAMRAIPLFLLPYTFGEKGNYVFTNPNKEDIMLSIILPDIETMGNPFEMLPGLCHELSHNFRVKTRADRNNALLDFIFDKTARRVINNWLASGENHANYATLGAVEKELLRKPLEEALKEKFRADCSDANAYDNANIGALLTNIAKFLSTHLFIDNNEESVSYSPFRDIDYLVDTLKRMLKTCLEYGSRNKIIMKYPDKFFTRLSEIERKLAELTGGNRDGISSELIEKISEMARIIQDLLITMLCIELDRIAEALTEQSKKDITEEKRNAILSWLVEFRKKNTIIKKIRKLSPQMLTKNNLTEEMVHDYDVLAKSLKSDIIGSPRTLCDEMMDACLDDALYAILDVSRMLNNVSYLARIVYQVSIRIEPQSAKKQNELLKLFHQKAHFQVATIQQKYYSAYMSDNTQQVLSALGIDLKESQMFVDSISGTLKGMSDLEINALIQDSTTLYREVFADLGMCKTIGLDVFGYINVLAHSSAFIAECKNLANNVSMERISMVANVLDINDQMSEFKNQCLAYFERYEKRVQALKPKSLQQYVQLTEICREMPEFLKDKTDYWLMPDLSKFAHDAIDKQEWMNVNIVWNTLYLAQYLIVYKDSFYNEKLRLHFREMLQNQMDECWREICKSFGDSRLFQYLKGYYNEGFFVEKPFFIEYTKYALEFILSFYYSAWLTLGCRFLPSGETYEDMEDSLEELIRGDLDNE